MGKETGSRERSSGKPERKTALGNMLSRKPFGSEPEQRFLATLYEKNNFQKEQLPDDTTPATLRPIVEEQSPERGKRFDELGDRVTKLADYLQEGRADNPQAAETAAELRTYGQQLQKKELPARAEETRSIPELTDTDRQDFDVYCGVERLHRLKYPEIAGDEPIDPEALAETRQAVMKQFFKVSEQAAEGSTPHQQAINRTYERYLQNFAKEPEAELVGAIIDGGLEQLSDVFDLAAAKENLANARERGDIQELADRERRILSGLQNAIDTIPYEQGAGAPVDYLSEGKIDCVNATAIGGKALKALGIPYATARMKEHIAIFATTSDGNVYWHDFINKGESHELRDEDLSGQTPDGRPLTIDTLREWIREPTKEGMVVKLSHETYITNHPDERDADHRDYVILAAPEQGHHIGILNKIIERFDDKEVDDEVATLAAEQERRLSPKDPVGYINGAASLMNLCQHTAALALIEQGLATGVNEPDFYRRKARILNDMDRATEALPFAQKSIEIDSEDASAWKELSHVQFLLEQWDAAADAFERILDLTPEGEEQPAWVHHDYGYVLSRLGRNEESLAQRTRAIEIDPENPIFWNNRGFIHLNLGNVEEAEADFMQALQLDANFFFARINLGELRYKKGDYEQASVDLERAIALDETIAEAYYYLALTQEKLGKTEGVRGLLEQAQQLAQQEEDQALIDEIQEKISGLSR